MAKSENQMKGEPCPICFESFPENLSVSPTGNVECVLNLCFRFSRYLNLVRFVLLPLPIYAAFSEPEQVLPL